MYLLMVLSKGKLSGVTFTLDGVRSGVAVVWGQAECKLGNFISATAGQSV